MGGKASTKEQLGLIAAALRNEEEEAVIIFPAGEVSRFGLSGIKDGKWRKGFLKIAEKAKAPILPIHINGQLLHRLRALAASVHGHAGQ